MFLFSFCFSFGRRGIIERYSYYRPIYGIFYFTYENLLEAGKMLVKNNRILILIQIQKVDAMADNEAIRGRDRHEVCRSIRTPLYYFISYLKDATHRPCQIYRATDADFIVRSHNELMRLLLLITKSR